MSKKINDNYWSDWYWSETSEEKFGNNEQNKKIQMVASFWSFKEPMLSLLIAVAITFYFRPKQWSLFYAGCYIAVSEFLLPDNRSRKALEALEIERH
jgi:hypothetical protein